MCAMYAYPDSRHECINCMFLVIKTGMIVSSISQTEVMIFFRESDISNTIDCVKNNACLQIRPRLLVDCHLHRMHHKIKPIVYPELSISESLQLDGRVCAVLSHKADNQDSCETCVKSNFLKLTHLVVSELYSVLLLSITENEGHGWHEMERLMRRCLGESIAKCATMQLFPEMICSEHEQYKESTESGDRLTDDTREQLRMGKDKILLWPPINNVGHGDTIADERAVFMVEFEATRPELCIRCMVSRTEVFFFSVVYYNQFGYFWMTQNHKGVLEYCLKNVLCTNLWYSAKE
ncbi:unnamed protein product [Albugo candida]|uniref:Uncharacterized protein n=1 Tax=Albugo candida TaxID=65357 RepID=A0A024FWT3_9STRA|nr:unnamed protein product [Albugo candida]|eukprot:CCI11382.1 unnamed protein product [Albugo candida]